MQIFCIIYLIIFYFFYAISGQKKLNATFLFLLSASLAVTSADAPVIAITLNCIT